MIPASVLIKMATIGLSPEQAEAVAGMLSEVEAATLANADEKQEQGKEKARERWRRWKANQTPTNVCKRLQTTTNDSCASVARGEDNLQTQKISGQEEKKVTSPSARSSRGSRIPDDFQPDIDAAVSEGVPRHEAERQARSFCDYWRSKPGSGGLKLDWPATWRVWYRRNIPPAHKPQSAAPPKKTTRASMWTEEAIAHGIIDEPDSHSNRFLDASFARGQDQGIVVPLRVAGSTSR